MEEPKIVRLYCIAFKRCSCDTPIDNSLLEYIANTVGQLIKVKELTIVEVSRNHNINFSEYIVSFSNDTKKELVIKQNLEICEILEDPEIDHNTYENIFYDEIIDIIISHSTENQPTDE